MNKSDTKKAISPSLWADIKKYNRYLWEDVLAEIGMPQKCLTKEKSNCPLCETGEFRFINENGNGTFSCSNCGSGDASQLIALYLRVPLEESYEIACQELDGLYTTEEDYQRNCALKDLFQQFFNEVVEICKTFP